MSDHYAALEKAGLWKRPKGPTLHPEMAYLWNAFARLHAARGSSGFGPAPISFSEIAAFDTLTAANLTAWEVEAIRALDDEYLTNRTEEQTTDG